MLLGPAYTIPNLASDIAFRDICDVPQYRTSGNSCTKSVVISQQNLIGGGCLIAFPCPEKTGWKHVTS